MQQDKPRKHALQVGRGDLRSSRRQRARRKLSRDCEEYLSGPLSTQYINFQQHRISIHTGRIATVGTGFVTPRRRRYL